MVLNRCLFALYVLKQFYLTLIVRTSLRLLKSNPKTYALNKMYKKTALKAFHDYFA